MDNDLEAIVRRKNELLKKIEERRRLMELIRNPHIKDTLTPLIKMKKSNAVKKIQVIIIFILSSYIGGVRE